jgi:hypothetical protein
MSRRYDDDDDSRSPAKGRSNLRAEVATRVRVPAIILLATATLSLLALAGLLVFLVIMLFVSPPQNKPDDILGVTFAFGGAGICLAVKLAVALGAVPMIRMRMYPLALTAAILQVIPCSLCSMLDIPIGIWALVVLLMPDVRAAFYMDDP